MSVDQRDQDVNTTYPDHSLEHVRERQEGHVNIADGQLAMNLGRARQTHAHEDTHTHTHTHKHVHTHTHAHAHTHTHTHTHTSTVAYLHHSLKHVGQREEGDVYVFRAGL